MTTPEIPPRAVAYFELAVSLYLWQWPALSLAVQNEWGGSDSSDKRDWLAGVLADMFTTNPQKEVDPEDIEDVATQVINDEFMVMLEDDSAYTLSQQLCGAWRDCINGDFAKIDAMKLAFDQAKPSTTQFTKQSGGDSDSSSDGPDEERMDVDAQPDPVSSAPVIDEDGFELVQKKNRRK